MNRIVAAAVVLAGSIAVLATTAATSLAASPIEMAALAPWSVSFLTSSGTMS